MAPVVCSSGYSISSDLNEDVLAIDTTESRLAILTSSHIYLHNTHVSINESASYEGTSTLHERIGEDIELLDLKLLSDHEVAYCTSATCGYCNISVEKAHCKRLSWEFSNETFDQQLASAAIAYIHQNLVLRLVDKNDNSAMLMFDIDKKQGNFTEIKIQSDTLDVPLISKQVAVAGFSRGHCVYFVATYLQNIHHFEWIDDNTAIAPYEHNTTLIKLTRSCFNGSQIVSTTELNIDCAYYNSNPIEKVLQARYDPKKEELWLFSLKGTIVTLCRISMKDVDVRFDNDMLRCQKPSIYENNESIQIFHNCISKNYSQMHWPADYNLFRGKHYGGWHPSSHAFTDLFIDPKYGDILYADIFSEQLHVYRRNSLASESDFFPIIVVPFNSNLQRQVIGLSRNSVFFINKTSVVSKPISCEVLYATCKSIRQDSSICAWCSDEDNERAVHINDKYGTCQRPLLGTCLSAVQSDQSIAPVSSDAGITSNVPDPKISKERLLITSKTVENEMDYLSISVLAGVLIMLVFLVGFIMLLQATATRQYSYNNDRPTELWQNSRPLLTSGTYDENTTPETIISTLSSSSSQRKYDYAYLFKSFDDDIKIDLSSLQINDSIGEGNFGVVYSGTYTKPDGDIIQVACKMLRDREPGVRTFFEEGLTMMKFKHARVIPFIGVALANDTDPIIVTKFMTNGNLLTYLQKNATTITDEQILVFAIQIAEGMEYLHLKKFIHRDLAARNCMLDYNMKLKIGDFGLARQCNNQNMYLSNNYSEIPFAWASIEALEFWTFTLKGDIWSYGVVLWELMSKGQKPYPKYTPNGLLNFLKEGGRLEKPLDCPEEFYKSIMLPCWDEDMNKRPSFYVLIELLQMFLQK